MKNERKVAEEDLKVIEGTTIRHQFDEAGNHRIVRTWKVGEGIAEEIGEWTWYRGIARIGPFAAVTDYYNGELPSIFKIIGEG